MMNEEMDRMIDISFEKIKTRIMIILVLAVIVLSVIQCNHQKESALADKLYNNLENKLQTYVDKDGYNRGKINILEDTNTKNFIKLHLKDSMLVQLQRLVKENSSNIKKGGSISIISTEGKIDVTVPTTVVDTSKCNPIYNSELDLKDKNNKSWICGNISANKDSTNVSLTYKEEMELVIGRHKTGFLGLGRGIPYADIKLLNPYSEVKDMRVYQTAPESTKYFHFGPALIYGVGSNFTPEFSVGIGVMWTPINF